MTKMADVTGSSTVDQFGSYYFQLSDMPNYNELTALYDQYMITGVKLTFVPRITEITGTTTQTGNLFVWPDTDDSAAVASMFAVYQIQGVKMRQANGRPFSIFLKPKPVDPLNTAASTLRAVSPRVSWIDTASADIPHYGIKWAISQGTYSNGIDVYGKYYMKFKAVR